MAPSSLSKSTLSGPRLDPLQGAATHLVVLVHGYGSDGNDLISLAPHWQSALPMVAWAAPNAPDLLPGSPGYQWFPISRIDPAEMQKGVESAGPVLDAFLDAELARLSLPPDKLILVGFSQGTMLSLHAGLRRAAPPAAIVGFSGMLAGAPPKTDTGPPILLTHGDADQVIPAQAMLAGVNLLGAAGYSVQWHLARGVGHGIDPETLDIAGRFLVQAVQGKLAGRGAASSLLGTKA